MKKNNKVIRPFIAFNLQYPFACSVRQLTLQLKMFSDKIATAAGSVSRGVSVSTEDEVSEEIPEDIEVDDISQKSASSF